MTEPDEGRPGGPDTPPAANPAPPTASPASESATADDTAVVPETALAAAAPSPTPPTPPAAASPPTTPAPAPAPAPVPVPAPTAAVAPATPAVVATSDAGNGYDDLDDYIAPRWVAMATTAGAGLIGVVALQVVLTLVEGLSVKSGQRFGVPDDLIHRIGYPFGSLGSTAVFFLLLGVVLLALPSILGEEVTDRQYSIAGAAMKTAIVLGVIVGLGSLLAVRGSLHEYSAKNVAVPGYVKVQFTNFLLATLAASAITVFGALAALRLRDEG